MSRAQGRVTSEYLGSFRRVQINVGPHTEGRGLVPLCHSVVGSGLAAKVAVWGW